jgi:carbamoyltransferase
MIILGINFKHADSSACLLKDGKIVAAVEEERFVRKKHFNRFPYHSINFCLQKLNINIKDVDYFALNNSPKSNLISKLIYSFKQLKNLNILLKKFKNKNEKFNLKKDLEKFYNFKVSEKKIKYVDHHLSHIASSYYCSNFTNSVVLSIDGSGDFSTTTWGIAKENKIKINERINYPNSLGIFYEAFTQFLGFEYFGDEYKIMGLAPYGKPTYYDKLKKIFFNKIQHNFEIDQKFFLIEKNYFNYYWKSGKLKTQTLLNVNKVEKLLKLKKRNPKRTLSEEYINLASSVQKIYEEIFFKILKYLNTKYKTKNLCIAGGCAMNSVANGKIKKNSSFKRIFIQPASGDSGGALGAALETYSKFRKIKRNRNFNSYLGPSYSNDEIKKLIEINKKKLSGFKIMFLKNKDLSDLVAQKISKGYVVGYFQGRMEWGARALGNRSILCDPRNPNAKELLNKKIKKRESFRPFAPSILSEKVKYWFEQTDKVDHMMQVFLIKKNKRDVIPAVTHVDGTGRLQTVSYETNKNYYNLIKSFFKITKIPMVLNTSFNENEPIVCKPKEALDTFLRTRMDILVLENWIIMR